MRRDPQRRRDSRRTSTTRRCAPARRRSSPTFGTALPGVDGRQPRRRHAARRAHRLRPAGSVTLCAGLTFDAGVAGAIRDLLRERYATLHGGVVPPARARARPRRAAQHLPASDPPRLRRGLRLQPRPARTDGTREQLTWTPRNSPTPSSKPTRCSPTRTSTTCSSTSTSRRGSPAPNLIGIGIVCGLEVTFEAPGTVHLSKGCGVTSQGYLIVEPDGSSTSPSCARTRCRSSTAIRRSSSPARPGASSSTCGSCSPTTTSPAPSRSPTSGLVLDDKAVRAVPRAAQGRPAQLQPEQLRRPRRRGDRHRPAPADRRQPTSTR